MRQKRNRFQSVIKTFFVLSLVSCMGVFLFLFDFEKNDPVIEFNDNTYWNLNSPLDITLLDDTGIKYYKVVFETNNNEKLLMSKVLKKPQTKVELTIDPPTLDLFSHSKEAFLRIEAIDDSKWNFFDGNRVNKRYKIHIDDKRPIAHVINNSLAIRHGGSAVVIVEAHDENLDDAYISFNDELRFELTPFYKKNFYIALITWPVYIEEFERVSLVARDKANNITKAKVPLYIRKLNAKKDTINISTEFIETISTSILEKSFQTIPVDFIDIFLKQNRELRANNIDFLRETSQEFMDTSFVDGFSLKPFRRLRGSKTVGHYAQKRYYLHNEKKIDEAWHLGVDWASIKNASIRTSNKGQVIFSDYLGIYGNTIVIDHGMGLLSLYAHTHSMNVSVGDHVNINDVIGKTGSTGAALGDHLHFGILIQGIEANPIEWMDKKWIKTRITDVINASKKIIDR